MLIEAEQALQRASLERSPIGAAPVERHHAVKLVALVEHGVDHLPERRLAGGQALWPAIKTNAYGHGAELVARTLLELGCDTLCVAHAEEAVELLESGVRATFVVMSASLPEQAEIFVEHGGMDEQRARAYLDELKSPSMRRYAEDVWC